MRSLSPGQVLVKIVRDELAMVMGAQASDLNLNVPAPAVILMAGLQGAGKTTTVAKLAKHLKEKRKKKVMAVSYTHLDVYKRQLPAIAQIAFHAEVRKQGAVLEHHAHRAAVRGQAKLRGLPAFVSNLHLPTGRRL